MDLEFQDVRAEVKGTIVSHISTIKIPYNKKNLDFNLTWSYLRHLYLIHPLMLYIMQE